MNFSSINFLFLFLPLIFPVYFLVPQKFRNYILIIFSFIFYFSGEKAFTLLLLFSCFLNYFIGKKINQMEGGLKKRILISGVVLNILLLLIFKYLNFFIGEINNIGILPLIQCSKLHLPVGISFFTFQALSYLVDIYRKDIEPAKFSNFTLYLSMFPQLVAGPIVRYRQIKDEISNRTIKSEKFTEGIKRFISGLSKKVIIADTLSYSVDKIFALNVSELSASVCILGAVCYSFQIFFDFSGYSDMAIGLGKMFGFTFPENFNYPYISKSIKEFWRRWHITLSEFFRDYVYIPLGGNKHHVYLNIMIVFALTGFWHGAAWNFIIWGLYNGALIAFERFVKFDRMPKILCHIYFIAAVITGWVIFRCENLSYGLSFLKTMYSFNFVKLSELTYYLDIELLFTLIIAAVLSVPFINCIKKYIPLFIQNLAYAILLIISASYIAVNTYQPFIYFRF